MNQKTHEPGAGDRNWDPSYNSWTHCVHPYCSRCSGKQDNGLDHHAAGADSNADSSPDPEEWVKSAELVTTTESRVQATEEDHEQQAQKEPQEN
jgi:hypothetical protein